MPPSPSNASVHKAFRSSKRARHSALQARKRWRWLAIIGSLAGFATVGLVVGFLFMGGGKPASLGRVAVVASLRHLNPADDPLTPILTVTGEAGAGDTVNYVVNVTGPEGDAVPSGVVSVTYVDTNNNTGSCNASLDSNGNGTCPLTESSADEPFVISASYGGDSNYSSASGVVPSLTVGDNAPGVETGGSFTYTATITGPTADPTPTGTVSWNVSGPEGSAPMCSDSTVSSGGTATCEIDSVLAGSYSVTATYSGDSTYTGSLGSDTTANVSQWPLTITATSTSSTYGTPPAVTADFSAFPLGQSATWLTTQPTCSTTVTGSTGVGTYTGANTCSGAVDPNYAITYVAADATVTQAPVTITASSTSTPYGRVPTVDPTYSPSADAGLLATPPTCSSTVTATTSVGTYPGANTCSGAADPNYDISYVAADATVTQASVTITASSTSTPFGTIPTVDPEYSPPAVAGSLATPPTCSSTVTATTGIGTYSGANTCSGAADPNYDVSYVAGDATVTKAGLTITASSTSSTYGNVPTVTASYSPPAEAGSLTTFPTCSSTVTATTNVGTYSGANTCTGAVDPNYNISYVAGDATVAKAALTIIASSTSAPYGTNLTVTASYSPAPVAGTLTIPPTCSSTVTATTGVGTYSGANTCSGAVDADYTITYVSGAATVTPASVTITASSTTTPYGTVPTVNAEYSPPAVGGSLATPPTCLSTVTATTGVGTYPGANTCSGAADPNYDISYVTGDATVTKAGFTITASSTSSTFGTVPTVTASYSPSGDAGSLTTLPTCSSAVTTTTNVGTYPGANTCTGAVDPNYEINYVAGDATVTKAALTITASTTSSVYGTVPTVTASYSPPVVAGTLTTPANCLSTVTVNTGVGSYSGANTCSGAVDADYAISYATGDATVTKASLTVTASTTSTAYGSAPTVTPIYAPSGDGGLVATGPTCVSTVLSTTGVGSYPGANSCSGAVDVNFTFTYLPGDATVTAASLTIKATDGSMTYGGSAPTITVASYTGFVNGDGASDLATQASCTSLATSASPVGSYQSICSGASASNYAISYSPGSVTVNPATLKVTASDATTTYGTAPTITPTYSGFVNGDTATSLTTKPTCASTDTGSGQVGTKYNSSCSGAVDQDYTISYVTGSVTVNPAALTVTASSPTFTYWGTVPAITASYSGFENGDTSSSLSTPPACSTTATSSSAVGSYPSTCSGAADSNYTVTYVAGSVTIAQATPTVTATGQSGQSTGPVIISVSVTGPAGAAVPTGTVTVTDAANSCTIDTLDATGSGSCSVVENSSDNGKSVKAQYSGDGNYVGAAGSTTESVTVATPVVSVNPPTSAISGMITYDVNVTGKGAAPTGNVTVSDGTNTCTGALNDVGVSACALTEATGTYSITAKYAGDGNYSSASATASEVVNETTTTLVVTPTDLVYGLEQSATFTVTVAPPPGMTTPPTGTTVDLLAGTQTLCVTTALTPTTVTVVDPVLGPVQVPVSTASCQLAPAAIPAGSYTVAANYAGDPGLFVGSVSPPATLTVASAPTSTTVTLSKAKTVYGGETAESVTVGVTVPSAGSSFVAGNVTVMAGATTLCTPTLEQGSATCQLTRAQLAAGTHSIVADYAGSSSLLSSASKPSTLFVEQAVSKSAFSLSHSSVLFGAEKSVKFTVQVTAPSWMPAAGGTVDLMSGTKKLCVVKLVRGKGSCSLTASELSVGSYSISAVYQGSTDLSGSTSSKRTLNINKPKTKQVKHTK